VKRRPGKKAFDQIGHIKRRGVGEDRAAADSAEAAAWAAAHGVKRLPPGVLRGAAPYFADEARGIRVGGETPYRSAREAILGKVEPGKGRRR
jgi:hypothetical protein